jgi:hypothetical protein
MKISREIAKKLCQTQPEIAGSRQEFLPSSRQKLGTLSKQDGNATTTAIHTMIFLISYKRNE